MFEIYSMTQGGFMIAVLLISSCFCLAQLVSFFRKEDIPFILQIIFDGTKIPAAALKTTAIFMHLLFCFLLIYGSSYFVVKVADSEDLRLQP